MERELSDHPDDTKRRIFAILIASSGNLVEWFDFIGTVTVLPP